MENLAEKVLFISPCYFDYHKIISKEISSLGYTVDWFDDRPTKNLIEKCILRINPNLLKHKINKYFYKKIIEKAKSENYKYVFVILGQSFNSIMFNDLKKEIPNARFILYLWDSVANFPSTLELSTAFDVTYSFDRYDCNKYGFKFLPLFYSSEIDTLKDRKTIKYDCSFIGTIKKGKLPYIRTMMDEFKKVYKNLYFFLFLQSRIVYLFLKIFDKDFKNTHMSDFNYKKLDYSKTLDLYNSSKYVIDITMKNQNGLPMRIFETLALSSKVITNNKDIVNYDFYNPQNIYVFDDKIDFNNYFFHSDFKEYPDNFRKYSINNWIRNIFDEGGNL